VATAPRIDRQELHAGMQVAVAVSGGADSVGLLRTLVLCAREIGLVLSVAHVHHGIRGAAADEDARFVAEMAARLELPFLLHRADTPARARNHGETLEEAGRQDRYAWFRDLLAQGKVNAVVTAHTLDDQAETVLHRLLRGAWTEGLGGIHPVIACPGGRIVRPFLETRHTEIVVWLRSIGQPWREDASNDDRSFTRNRIRHELLPQLAQYNPRIEEQLARVAAMARDEEAWWEAEVRRLLPSLVLPGRPVRGGGRAVSTHPDEGSVGIELERLRELAPAVGRRILRAAAQELGCELNFEATDRLMNLSDPAAPRRLQLTAEVRAERTPRELRLVREGSSSRQGAPPPESVELPIPGEAAGLGVRLRAMARGSEPTAHLAPARLRGPQPGDRVRMRHSRNARPLKEVFERMQVESERRRNWPLLEWGGRIVWMQGVDVDPETDLPFEIEAVGEELKVEGPDGAASQ
jgi:tRNA(Ile)-lysidine synthase